MAQQFIKIFDDTVLKQSVNQGFEVQRTNSRLGKFTMGELAFTRDTGRLFAGTYTNLNEEKDANPILGGSLVGNKYLGLIDSKPLTHWNSDDNETSVQFPLSYETENTGTVKKKDAQGNTYNEPLNEPALFGKNSKFRIDKNKGWSKEATYNETYDAYNGDYLYDVYNNAIILFDKNIKPLQSTDDKNWDVNGNIQQFIKADENYYTETTGDFSTNRTRLENVVKNTAENQDVIQLGNANHPIYGDGYVVMRILEPDGITLGYKDRVFNQTTGEADNNNYSHNYLELKTIPIDILHKMFDEKQFTTSKNVDGNTMISLTGNMEQISVDAISGSKLSLPATLTFNKEINDGVESCTYTFTSKSENTNKILGVNIDNEIVLTTPAKLLIKTNSGTDTFVLNFGETTEIDLTVTEDEEIETSSCYKIYEPFITDSQPSQGQVSYDGATIYNSQGNAISQELIPAIKSDEYVASADATHYEFVNYDSSGRDSFSYEVDVLDEDGQPSGEKENEAQFNHGFVNVKLNYVKTPEPILWKNGAGQGLAQFFIRPFVISPTNFNDATTNSYGCIGNCGIEGEGLSANPYTFVSANSVSISDDTITGVKIPEHAQSVICEVSNYSSGFLHLYTSTRYTAALDFIEEEEEETTEPTPDDEITEPTPDDEVTTVAEGDDTTTEEGDETTDTDTPEDTVIGDTTKDEDYLMSNTSTIINNLLAVTNTTIPSQIFETPRVKIIDSIINYSETPQLTIKTIELPLYRDGNGMKHFTLGFKQGSNELETTSVTVIRVIGYRA